MPDTNSLDRYLFLLLCTLVAWAPLPYSSDHIWSESLLIVLSFGILLFWLVLYLCGQVRTTSALRLAKWPLVFLVGIQLSVVIQLIPIAGVRSITGHLSIVPYESLHSLFLGLGLTVAFVATLLLVNTERRVRTLLWILVLSGVFQACYGTLMVLTGYEYGFFLKKPSFIGSNVGTMFYRNQQAGYLVLCLCAGIGLMITDMKGSATSLRRWFVGFSRAVVGSKGGLRICLVIIVAGLVMTRSRMGNSSFAIALAIVGLIFLLARKEHRVNGLIFLGSIILIDIAVLGTFFDLEDLSQRIIATDIGTDGRALMAPNSWTAAKNYLPFGSGAMSYYSAFIPFRGHSFSGIAMTHAHNDYLEFLVEYGVVGCLFLVLFWCACLVRAIKAVIASKNPLSRGAGFGVLMLLIAIALHSSVDYNLQATGYTFSMLVFIACLFSLKRDRRRKPRENESISPASQ